MCLLVEELAYQELLLVGGEDLKLLLEIEDRWRCQLTSLVWFRDHREANEFQAELQWLLIRAHSQRASNESCEGHVQQRDVVCLQSHCVFLNAAQLEFVLSFECRVFFD